MRVGGRKGKRERGDVCRAFFACTCLRGESMSLCAHTHVSQYGKGRAGEERGERE
jgi:hypothetical protein